VPGALTRCLAFSIEGGYMDIRSVKIDKPDDVNIVLGHSHFIKTAEDLYEAIVNSVPNAKFGLAFCEASGPCLVRSEGNDEDLKKIAQENGLSIGAGHCFIILIKDAFPINIIGKIKEVAEVCTIYCATANPVEVLLAKTDQGRGVIGVVDGSSPKGIETEDDKKQRKEFLRKIGYKL